MKSLCHFTYLIHVFPLEYFISIMFTIIFNYVFDYIIFLFLRKSKTTWDDGLRVNYQLLLTIYQHFMNLFFKHLKNLQFVSLSSLNLEFKRHCLLKLISMLLLFLHLFLNGRNVLSKYYLLLDDTKTVHCFKA